MKHSITNNLEKNRYELSVDGTMAVADYIHVKDKIIITHTIVPEELEGKGIGSLLIKQVLEDIKVRDLYVVPECEFVRTYIEKHPEWKSIVSEKE